METLFNVDLMVVLTMSTKGKQGAPPRDSRGPWGGQLGYRDDWRAREMMWYQIGIHIKKAKLRVTRQITTYIFGSTVGEQFKHHFRQSPFHMSTFNICVLLQVIHLGALHCFLNFEERIFQCFHCNNANGFKLDFYTGFSYWIGYSCIKFAFSTSTVLTMC